MKRTLKVLIALVLIAISYSIPSNMKQPDTRAEILSDVNLRIEHRVSQNW